MNAEELFEKWWDETISESTRKNDILFPEVKTIVRIAFTRGFTIGRKAGIDAANSLPHRAMFDEGYARGIVEGQKEEREACAKLVESKYWENRNDCAEAIRCRGNNKEASNETL